jgi:3-phosphoglycerate kinase
MNGSISSSSPSFSFSSSHFLRFIRLIVDMKIGKSLYDEEGSKIVQKIMDKAKQRNVTIHFPVDYVTGDKFDKNATVGKANDENGIADDQMGLDIGPESIKVTQREKNKYLQTRRRRLVLISFF